MFTRDEMKEIISKEVRISKKTMTDVLDFAEATWDENSIGLVFHITGSKATGKSKLLKAMADICNKTLFIDDGFVLHSPRAGSWMIKHMVLIGYKTKKVNLPVLPMRMVSQVEIEGAKLVKILNHGAERA